MDSSSTNKASHTTPKYEHPISINPQSHPSQTFINQIDKIIHHDKDTNELINNDPSPHEESDERQHLSPKTPRNNNSDLIYKKSPEINLFKRSPKGETAEAKELSIELNDLTTAQSGESKRRRESGDRKEFHMKLWKTPKECAVAITQAATKKSMNTLDKTAALGFLAGIFVALGGCFAIIAGQGMPGMASSNPGVPKVVGGFCFAIALLLITIVGGELFTGNTMYFISGYLAGTIKPKHLAVNWVIVFLSNFVGCLTGAYFFGYITDVFGEDPWKTGIIHIAEKKTIELEMYQLFFRAIPANMLVCLAIFISLASEDVVSKTVGMYLPVAAFASIGFEHSIANMFYVPLGIMYGANTTFGRFFYYNLIPVACGNIIGGGICVGAFSYYLYLYQSKAQDSQNVWKWTFTPTA